MLVYNIDMYIGGFLVIYKRSPNIKLKKKKKIHVHVTCSAHTYI